LVPIPTNSSLTQATIAGDAIIRIYDCPETQSLQKWSLIEEISALPPNAPPQHSGESSFALAWCPSRFGGQQLVVAANNLVQLFRPDDRNQWISAEVIQDDAGLVRCVDWASGGQRGYELIATGSKTGIVRIYKLTESMEGVIVGGGGYVSQMVGQFEHQGGVSNDVQRVAWNVIGTVLSSSGDDGRVRIWKEDHLGKWRQQSVISAEQYDLNFPC
jgi:nucleoporin SEH1